MAQTVPEPDEESTDAKDSTESKVRPLRRAPRAPRRTLKAASDAATTESEPASAGPTGSARGTAKVTRVRPAPAPAAPAEAEIDPLEIAREVVQLASDKGAADILLMDIRKMSIIADYFVICSGDNERQIRAINRGIRDGIGERWGINPRNSRATVEQEQAGWVILDYSSVIVHVFSPQTREFYRLERLWSEAATLLRMQ